MLESAMASDHIPAVERLMPLQAPPELVGQHRRVWPDQATNALEAAKLPAAPTSNASIATTEVLVSPKGEMIAVAPLTNEKGSLLSACATPCSTSPSSPSHSSPVVEVFVLAPLLYIVTCS